ncbi:MAG: hypothetical protein HY538_03955 [Deltaproteobacteria bacterium]|nr:hypothetical protein [Deltaproteobacteria bacterium]
MIEKKDSIKLLAELEESPTKEETLRVLLEILTQEYKATEEEWNREMGMRTEILEEETPLFDRRMEAQILAMDEVRSRLLRLFENGWSFGEETRRTLEEFVVASRSLDHRLRGAMILLSPAMAQNLKKRLIRLADQPRIQQLLKGEK